MTKFTNPPLAGTAFSAEIEGEILQTTELAPAAKTSGNSPWYTPAESLRTPSDYDGKRNKNYDTKTDFPSIIATSVATNLEELQPNGDIL